MPHGRGSSPHAHASGPAALTAFPATYAAGVDGKAAGAAWNQNDPVDVRFTVTQNDDAAPNGHTTATATSAHSFTWEARNN